MSSGNGGVVNVESLSGEGNFFENIFADIANAGLQVATGGFLGYENGQVSGGATTNTLKEVTGAKAAEDANEMARKQFEQVTAQAEQDRKNSIAQTAKDQMKQSQMAQGARASASTRSTNKGGAIGSMSLGEDEKDFLGL